MESDYCLDGRYLVALVYVMLIEISKKVELLIDADEESCKGVALR
jgi:hypothetical protein